jgi:hypothetical protein
METMVAPSAPKVLIPNPAAPGTDDPPPLHSVRTSNFSLILQELDVSILVTTYQARFRGFSKPIGLAVDGDRLAIGVAVKTWEYHNAPAVAP